MAVQNKTDSAAALARLTDKYGGREQVMGPAKEITTAADLIGHVIYQVMATQERSKTPDIDPADVKAALSLIPALRACGDDIEESILMAARTTGLTWREIAESLGLESPQAAAQRWGRLTGSNMSGVNVEA